MEENKVTIRDTAVAANIWKSVVKALVSGMYLQNTEYNVLSP